MFKPKEYWKNRKAGKRGQGEYPEPVFHPKGEVIAYEKQVKKDGKVIGTEEAEYPNDQGKHFVFGRGLVSRKESRQKLRPVKDTTAEDLRKEKRAADHKRRNDGEHARALKKKEAK